MRAHITTACAALTLGAAAALATPAAAQYAYSTSGETYVGEVVVPGRYGPNGPNTLSRVVSYRDLDLTTYAGQRELKLRIRDTARDVCRELGEGRGSGGSLLGRSCVEDAVQGARGQMRFAVARAQARSYYASLY
jgi:UrcA family protein